MSKEAMKLALEALNNSQAKEPIWKTPIKDAIKALEEALAKQEGQSNFCQQCEALARELKAIKQEQHTLSSRVNDVRVHIEHGKQHDEAMKLITAKQEQRNVSEHTGEPVARVHTFVGSEWAVVQVLGKFNLEDKFYTTPQQRKPLTDEQRREIAARWRDGNGTASEIIDMVEAAYGIKENT